MRILQLSSDKWKHRRSSRPSVLPQKHAQILDSHDSGFHGASFSGAVYNLSTTIVGAGIMALPATVKQLGLLPGLAAIVLVALLTDSSIDMLLKFSRASKLPNYSGVIATSLGGTAGSLLQFCVVVNNLGMLVVYMVIIGDVFSGTWVDGVPYRGVMAEWFGEHLWTTRPALLLLTTLFFFAPLISFKRVDSLRHTSALSVALAVVFVAITAAVAIVKLIDGHIGMPRLMPKHDSQASFWKLFTTFPILVTAYICHHNVLPIENELKDTSQMKSVVQNSLILCCTVYISTSFFGFLLFGDHTLDDVLANFDGDLGIAYSSLLDDVVRVSYGIHLMLVFPVVFFSLRLSLYGLLFPHAIPITLDSRRFYVVTTVLMGLIFVGANFVPSIWDAFQFTGATATVVVGYIFPAAIVLRDIHKIATKKDRITAGMMIVLAISSSLVAMTSDVYSMFKLKRDAS